MKDEICPKCGSALGPIVETSTGRQLQRCSAGSWNKDTRMTEGCDYVRWLPAEPVELEEKCPKCGNPVILVITRFGKKMKRCSTNKWDPKTKTSTGCDYFDWVRGTSEELTEDCPKCGNKLILYTTAAGKKMKKCSTSQWDPQTRTASGCDFIEWLK